MNLRLPQYYFITIIIMSFLALLLHHSNSYRSSLGGMATAFQVRSPIRRRINLFRSHSNGLVGLSPPVAYPLSIPSSGGHRFHHNRGIFSSWRLSERKPVPLSSSTISVSRFHSRTGSVHHSNADVGVGNDDVGGDGDTIYALATGALTRAGVCIIRLSGPKAFPILDQLLQKGKKEEGIGRTNYDLSSSSESSVSDCGNNRTVQSNINMRTQTKPKPRYASLRYIYCPKTTDIIDKAIILTFPGPNSFTGEDVVEFHLHGSKAVIQGLVEAFEYLDSVDRKVVEDKFGADSTTGVVVGAIRPADRGEFSRRAFENGRMDLTEVEGLADLIDAETPLQRGQAFRQMEGKLSHIFDAWRQELVRCLAHTEAVIDFGDDDREDDVNESAFAALIPKVEDLRADLLKHLSNSHRGEMVRDGVQIALVGAPNAGKSSLMNALAGRSAAIVSHIAGTTRDVVEVKLNLAGVPCIVRDTAGIREGSTDVIELEGMRRSREAFHTADIKILVTDSSSEDSSSAALDMTNSLIGDLKQKQLEMFERFGGGIEGNDDEDDEDAASPLLLHENIIIVRNKADLLLNTTTSSSSSSSSSSSNSTINKISQALQSVGCGVMLSSPVSCITGQGIQDLESTVSKAVLAILSPDEGEESRTGYDIASTTSSTSNSTMKLARSKTENVASKTENVFLTRARHRRHVEQCVDHLDAFLSMRLPMDAAAEELRLAMMELGKVTGVVDVEEILDVIFRDFCIGK